MKRKVAKDNILSQRLTFVAIAFLIIAAVLFIRYEGSKQDEVWLADYKIYLGAKATYDKGLLEEAKSLYASLLNKPAYQDSVEMNLQLGLISTRNQENEKALGYYEKARNVYPAIVNNPIYLKSYAFTLSETGDYDKALKYLERIMVMQSTDSDKQWASQAIQAIKEKLK